MQLESDGGCERGLRSAAPLPSTSVLAVLWSVWPHVITTASSCDVRQEVGFTKKKG